MAEIRKKYDTKFPREVIEEAHKVFREHLGENCGLKYAEWHIRRGDEELTLDTENEFYYGYREPLDQASVKYTYALDEKLYVFSMNYDKSIQKTDRSTVIISLKTQEDVKHVFNIFEKNYVKPNSEDGVNTLSRARDRTKYNEEKTIPSCHVDKNLLRIIESIFMKISRDDNISKYRIKLYDSNGTEELPSMDDYSSEYFPNDTRRISISCSDSSFQDLSITFDKKKEESKLEISIIGSQAREDAGRIRAEIMSALDDYRTKNYIFHLAQIDSFLLLILIMPILALISVGIYLFEGALASEAISSILIIMVIIIIMIVLYKFFSALITYTTFKTKKYESFQGWKNWLIFASLEFILFTALGGTILKYFKIL